MQELPKAIQATAAPAEMRRNSMICWVKSPIRKTLRFSNSASMTTLFLSPPSFDGFDGGAGSRYQARREVTSFWYPTWLAQPAALVPNAKLMDCAPHNVDIKQCLEEARGYDPVMIHTSTPSLKNDCKVAEAIKQNRPETRIGFVGAHAAVLPAETLKASWSIDWVGRKEFDFTCKEVADGRPIESITGLSYRDKENKI